MDYARFARLTIGIGTAVIVAAAVLTLTPTPNPVELVAVLLLVAVLVGAVQWGRRGGTITAIAATVVYVFLRAPELVSSGIDPTIVIALVVHAALYGAIGVGGGMACASTKVALARARDASAVDETSLVYTPQFIGRLLTAAMESFARYGGAFSVIVLTLERTPGARPGAPEDVARAIGAVIRRELRLVDDVGRLSEGAFVVLLPQTTPTGARVVASRLHSAVAEALAVDRESLSVRTLSALEDFEAIEAIANEHTPPAA